MGKFTFRLATLLHVRENARDACRTDLAITCRDDAALGRQQEELDRQQAELRDQTREAAGPGEINLERLVALQRYDRVVTTQQEELDRQRQRLAEEIARRRTATVAADREVQILEKLEQKQLRRHREQEQRAEARRLDEVTMARGKA